MSDTTKKADGKAGEVFIEPGKPVEQMTHEDWLELGRTLFDELSAQRDQHRRTGRRTG